MYGRNSERDRERFVWKVDRRELLTGVGLVNGMREFAVSEVSSASSPSSP